MLINRKEESSHWYLPDGTPFHEIEKLDGSGKRPTTLADARKRGALPSITNILGCIHKGGLEKWKIEQAILASLTLPRITGESEDHFAARVVEDMGEHVSSAAELGTACHSAIAHWFETKTLPADREIANLITPFTVWAENEVANIGGMEKVVVCNLGYAGRYDLLAEIRGIGWAMIDFKTQGIKPGKKANLYETWPLQLEAYRHAVICDRSYEGEVPRKNVSIIINSYEPAPITVHVWPDDEYTLYYHAFDSAFSVWKYLKDYDPRLPSEV